MFAINDLWKILRVIRGETVTDISSQTKAVARSEQGIATSLFSNVLDQNVFLSDDYRRFRNFLIDMYAALRTMTTVQAQATDPLSLPEDHLDELFKSFGYNYSTVLSSFGDTVNVNKTNFFLDLVNLYKMKGTPQALIELLQYYSLINVDIVEYSVLKNTENKIVLRGDIAAASGTVGTDLPLLDLNFNNITIPDPHWLLTESNIEQLILANKINLPSKSPYFSIRCRGFDLVSMDIEIMLLTKKINEQYVEWQSTGSISEQDAYLTGVLGYRLSVLELYLSCIYLFNKQYPVGTPRTDPLWYDGTATANIDIDAEYKASINTRPITRPSRNNYLTSYYKNFTRSWSESFLTETDSAENLLDQINPSLKQELINLQDVTAGDVLSLLFKDLARWIRVNIGSGYPNIAYWILGEKAIEDELGDPVNFFKPYSSRLLYFDIIRPINYPLHDSLIVEEEWTHKPSPHFYDYVTPDSRPCCPYPETECYDSTAVLWYSRETYDCGSYYDIGSCMDIVRIYVWDSTSEVDITQFVPTPDASDPAVEVVTLDFISSSSSSSESSSSSSESSSSSSESSSSSSSSESSSSSSESSSSSSSSESSSSSSSSESSSSSSSSESSSSSSSSESSSSSSSSESSSSSSSVSSSSSSSSESSSSSSESSSSSSSESSSSSSSSESSSSSSSSESSSSSSESSSSSSESSSSSSSSSESSSSSSESSSSSSESSSSSSSSESSSSSSSSSESSSSSSSSESSSSSSSESSSSSSCEPIWFGCDAEPGDKDGATVGNYTYIFNEPAPQNGYITKIEVNVQTVAVDSTQTIDFAVFQRGVYFTDVEVVEGLVYSGTGLNVWTAPYDFDSADLYIKENQYMGFYMHGNGTLERHESGGPGPGYWFDEGDQISDTPAGTTFSFSINVGYEIQIRVWIACELASSSSSSESSSSSSESSSSSSSSESSSSSSSSESSSSSSESSSSSSSSESSSSSSSSESSSSSSSSESSSSSSESSSSS